MATSYWAEFQGLQQLDGLVCILSQQSCSHLGSCSTLAVSIPFTEG